MRSDEIRVIHDFKMPRSHPKIVEGLPLRVAAVGCGWVCRNRHLPTMDASPAYKVHGVIDRRPGIAEQLSRRRGYAYYTTDYELARVSWLEEVEAVVIATSPLSHFQIAEQALLLGKHVLTEKPFAMLPAEGEKLVALAAERGLTLGVVHNFQFAPSTRRLMADITAGRLGEIRAILATQLSNPRRRLPTWYEDLPCGLFYDESPHLLYLLRMLAPRALEMQTCRIFPSTLGKKTPAAVQVGYRAMAASHLQIPVQLSLNFESPISEWHLAVLGDLALGDVDIFRDIYVRLPNDGQHAAKEVLRTTVHATAQHWGQHLTRGLLHLTGRLLYGNEEVFDRFAAAVRSHEQPAAISGHDALAVLRMQHEILGGQCAAPTGAKAAPA